MRPLRHPCVLMYVEWCQISDRDSQRIVDHLEWFRCQFRHQEPLVGTWQDRYQQEDLGF